MATSQQQLAFAIRAVNEASATLKAVQGDIDAVGKSAGTADTHTGKLGTSLGTVSKVAGGFLLANGLMQAPGILMNMAQGAAEDAASFERLKKAVENTGTPFAQFEGSLNAQISLAQKRAFTDDQARNSLSLLMAQTGDASEAQKRFALAMDLSRGAGIDLETASKLLGKVTEENISVLGRYGITMKEGATEADLFGAVQEKFGGQAETFANSAAGQGEAVKIAMSEAQESIGYLLLPAMAALTNVLNTAVIPAIGFLTNHADILIPVLAGVATAIAVALVPATWAYVSALVAQAAAFVVANAGLILIGVAIAAVVAGVIIAVRHWDEIKEAMGRFADFVMDKFQSMVGWLQDAFFAFLDSKFVWLAGLLGPVGILVLIFKFRDEFIGAFEWIRDRVSDVMNATAGVVKGAVNLIIDGINTLIRGLNGIKINIPSVKVGPIQTPGFSWGGMGLPEIPRLAEGGIVRARPGGTLAILGEGGQDEAVVPLGRGGAGIGGVVINVFAWDVSDAAQRLLPVIVHLERGGNITPISIGGVA